MLLSRGGLRAQLLFWLAAHGQALLMHWPWPATDEQLKIICDDVRAVTFSPAG